MDFRYIDTKSYWYAAWSLLVGVVFILLFATPARADWMNLTGAETSANIAEITVLEDRVNIRLEIYIGNLDTFIDLVPDSLRKDGGAGRPPESERLAHFSKNGLSVRVPGGAPLPARLKRVEPRLRIDRKSAFAGMINPQTRQRVPDAPADKRVLFAELDYPFDGKPETLIISPPSNQDGKAAVTIGFIAYHKAVPVIDFRFLGAPARINLDWDDPWYSKFDNPNLKRHHRDALMSFLYVEPREVRHEALVRVRDLQQWTELGLGSADTILPAQRTLIKKRARQFFEGRNPLQIDGKPLKPKSSRAAFLSISLSGLQVIETQEPLDLSTAILGVILSYPVPRLPQNVKVKWELFNDRIKRIPTTATDPAGPLKSYIDSDDPVIEWQNFLRKYVERKSAPVTIDAGTSWKVPVTSALLILIAAVALVLTLRPRYLPRYGWAGLLLVCGVGAFFLRDVTIARIPNPVAGPPDEAVAARIVTAVLDNVHTAFLEKTEPALVRELAIAVADSNFADIKTELSRSLAIKVAGGGIARVTAIEDLTVKEIAAIEGREGFRSVAEWTALASAGHWGHAHRRKMRFRALMEVARIDGAWKLAGMTVVDLRQMR